MMSLLITCSCSLDASNQHVILILHQWKLCDGRYQNMHVVVLYLHLSLSFEFLRRQDKSNARTASLACCSRVNRQRPASKENSKRQGAKARTQTHSKILLANFSTLTIRSCCRMVAAAAAAVMMPRTVSPMHSRDATGGKKNESKSIWASYGSRVEWCVYSQLVRGLCVFGCCSRKFFAPASCATKNDPV